jgi:leucyl-tRNA synthetase
VKDGAKMSKSKGNVVIPDEYITSWGADTFRMYLMFLGPFEDGGDFRDEGLAGPRRFLDKVWDLVGQCEARTLVGNELQHGIVVKWNQTKKKVTEGLEHLSYNTAIAALMEFLNALRAVNCSERKIVKDLVVMLAPFAPHFAEECWERLGAATSVFEAAWPSWEVALTVEPEIEVPVQVKGKTRGRIRLRRGAGEAEAVAAARRDATVARFLDGGEIVKIVWVPDRLLNLVTR